MLATEAAQAFEMLRQGGQGQEEEGGSSEEEVLLPPLRGLQTQEQPEPPRQMLTPHGKKAPPLPKAAVTAAAEAGRVAGPKKAPPPLKATAKAAEAEEEPARGSGAKVAPMANKDEATEERKASGTESADEEAPTAKAAVRPLKKEPRAQKAPTRALKQRRQKVSHIPRNGHRQRNGRP